MILGLEKQVCSLESAKRLKELGCPQESLFYWIFSTEYAKKKLPRVYGDYQPRVEYASRWKDGTYGAIEQISAYTVAELGELLPMTIELFNGKKMVLVQGKTIGNQNRVDYRNAEISEPLSQIADTEAEARARMIIYLLNRKFMEIKTCQ